MDSPADRGCTYADAAVRDLAQQRLRLLGGDALLQEAQGIAEAYADRLHPGQDPDAEQWADAYTRSLMRTAELHEHR